VIAASVLMLLYHWLAKKSRAKALNKT
jgi:hypothetical protein